MSTIQVFQLSPTNRLEIAESIDSLGFAVIVNVVNDLQIAHLTSAIEATIESTDSGSILRRGETNYAIRNLLESVPAVRELANSPPIRNLVEPILGRGAIVVLGILFDKPPGANWKVPWHQDLTIEVRERRDVPGFGPWSIKAGITHVQPPPSILEQMLAVRIHLDDSTIDNGPLRIVPNSHQAGRLTTDQILSLRNQHGELALIAPRGSAILMRPLLAHASSSANLPLHRRVIHLEYAAADLPDGLEWRNAFWESDTPPGKISPAAS